MSADSFHHNVDFVECVAKRGSAVIMKSEYFIDYPDEKGSGRDFDCAMLHKVSEIQFRQVSTKMYCKQEFGDAEYKQTEYLKKKCDKLLCDGKRIRAKKKEIVKKLSPFLFLQNHVKFWQDVPLASNTQDLTVNVEHSSVDI